MNIWHEYADKPPIRQTVARSILLFLWIGLLLAACQPAAPVATPTPTPAPLATPTMQPVFSIGDAAMPQLGNADIDVLRYTLRLALDPQRVYVQGSATLELQIVRDGIQTLALDLVGLTVDSVLFNGRPAAFERQPTRLLIHAPLPLAHGQYATLTIAYQGVPQQQPSAYNHLEPVVGLVFPGDGTLFALSQPDGARTWFPANDHLRDKALFAFELDVPTGLTGIANGRLRAALANGPTTRFVWEHSAPMAPYLATVIVGDYERIEQPTVDGTLLRHYWLRSGGVAPIDRAAFEQAIALLPEAIAWMSAQFGPYPFETFGFVTVNSHALSLETQTLALLSDAAYDPATQQYMQRWIIHELAHMWFGNWVGLDSWSEMWRNEGLATYVELLWATRNDPAQLEAEIARLEATVAAREAAAERRYALGEIPATRLLQFENYYKGALFVHALRQEMGDAPFFAGLRAYLARYGGGSADDGEFRRVMEDAAGRSLVPVYDRWFVAAP